MKYLLTYKLFESLVKLTLFHGTPFNFKKFKNRTTYFSDDINFAHDYSNTKSMDGGLDADTKIATCEFNGNLFKSSDTEDMNKLIALLPDKVKVSHGTVWFMDHDFDKEEMIKRLKGIATIKPIDYIANANVGDEIPDPSYKSDLFMVVDKDEEYVYTIHKKTYFNYLRASSAGHSEHFRNECKYKDLFLPWRQAMVDVYNQCTESKRTVPTYGSMKDIIDTINHAKHNTDSDGSFDFTIHNRYKPFKISKEQLDYIDNIYAKCLAEFDKVAKKELYVEKWNRKTIDEPMEDTWTYFENPTVSSLIQKLGYDGYVALEKKKNTYAIFEPDKTIKILSIK